MQSILLGIFLVAASVAAAPLDIDGNPVELIVNGVPEGQPIELGDIVNLKLKQKVDGEVVSSSDLLYPLTSQAIAEAAAAAALEDASHNDIPDVAALPEISKPEVESEVQIIPEPIVLPAPVAPEVVPEPIALPAPAAPEVVPEPIVLPSLPVAEALPEPVGLPSPAAPEVIIPEPVVLPSPPKPEIADAEIIPSPVIVVPSPVDPEHSAEPAVVENIPSPASQHIYNDGIVSVEINNNSNLSYFQQMQSWVHIAINYLFQDNIQTIEV